MTELRSTSQTETKQARTYYLYPRLTSKSWGAIVELVKEQWEVSSRSHLMVFAEGISPRKEPVFWVMEGTIQVTRLEGEPQHLPDYRTKKYNYSVDRSQIPIDWIHNASSRHQRAQPTSPIIDEQEYPTQLRMTRFIRFVDIL